MVFNALPGLIKFLKSFKGRFAIVLLNVLIIILWAARKFYYWHDYQSSLEVWVSVLMMFVLFYSLTIVFFRADFVLINGTVTQFSIDGDNLTIRTSPLKIPLIFNRSSLELNLTMRQFARDKTIYPIRIFPFVKYSCWELRTDDGATVYIISQFFSPEAIAELEKFLYWKNLEIQNV